MLHQITVGLGLFEGFKEDYAPSNHNVMVGSTRHKKHLQQQKVPMANVNFGPYGGPSRAAQGVSGAQAVKQALLHQGEDPHVHQPTNLFHNERIQGAAGSMAFNSKKQSIGMQEEALQSNPASHQGKRINISAQKRKSILKEDQPSQGRQLHSRNASLSQQSMGTRHDESVHMKGHEYM